MYTKYKVRENDLVTTLALTETTYREIGNLTQKTISGLLENLPYTSLTYQSYVYHSMTLSLLSSFSLKGTARKVFDDNALAEFLRLKLKGCRNLMYCRFFPSTESNLSNFRLDDVDLSKQNPLADLLIETVRTTEVLHTLK